MRKGTSREHVKATLLDYTSVLENLCILELYQRTLLRKVMQRLLLEAGSCLIA
jgi:hypothetical protein